MCVYAHIYILKYTHIQIQKYQVYIYILGIFYLLANKMIL